MYSYIFIFINMILLLFCLCLTYSNSRLGILSPIFVTAFGLFTMYVLRPIYIIMDGWWGVSPAYRYSLFTYEGLFEQALMMSMMSIFVFVLVVLIYMSMSNKIFTDDICIIRLQNQGAKKTLSIYWLLIFVCIAIFCYGISKSGGIVGYVNGLGVRGAFFKYLYGDFGHYVMLAFYFIESATLILISEKTCDSKKIDKEVLALVIIVVFFLSTMGGRSNILFFVLSVCFVFYVNSTRGKKEKTVIILTLMSAFVIFYGVVYRVILRDQHFVVNLGVEPITLVLDALSNLFDFFLGGYDFVQIDSLMVLIGDNEMPLLYGKTIASAFVSFIPRAFWPEKPLGAMTEFTKEYFPIHYLHSQGGEFVVSWLGELYMNFGSAGLPLGMLLLAIIVVFMENYFRQKKEIGLIAFVLIAIFFYRPFNLLKGDFYNNYMAIVKLSVVPVLLIISSNFEKVIKR